MSASASASLELFDHASPEPERTPAHHNLPMLRASSGRLWIALCLPNLSLEALLRGLEHSGQPLAAPTTPPTAVVAATGQKPTVIGVNASAAAAGVLPGLSLGMASVLAPELRMLRRDREVERSALEALAAWCLQFTPNTCITSAASLIPSSSQGVSSSSRDRIDNVDSSGVGLLLEVSGSLRLFDGLDALMQRIRAGVATLGYTACSSAAPTAMGAWLLARAGLEQPVTALGSLPGRLAQVPLDCLPLGDAARSALRAMGIESFGACARLPRDGMSRRVGLAVVEMLDRALGRQPEALAPHVLPAVFERRLDLGCEGSPAVRDTHTLLLAAGRLLIELEGFLVARGVGALALEVHLAHYSAPATRLTIELVSPAREQAHLLGLFAERLHRLTLAEGVEYLGLRVTRFAPLAPRSGDLYARNGYSTESACAVAEPRLGDEVSGKPDPHLAQQQHAVPAQLIERLRARLGASAVLRLSPVPDHRPERAQLRMPVGVELDVGSFKLGTRTKGKQKTQQAIDAQGLALLRPLWLLEPARPLRTTGISDGAGSAMPFYHGVLALLTGPERIESGWWDDGDIARDYYLARNPRGEHYWIYRERRHPRGWYLHGVFA